MNTRCPWPKTDLDIQYHDQEWGRPQRDEKVLFEFLLLEGAQAGLSWSTILAKRENYRAAFDGFDSSKIARYDDRKVASLLSNPGIVRNRLKVAAAITNAQAHLRLLEQGRTLHDWLWSFVDGEPIDGKRRSSSDVPVSTPESDAMSRALKQSGFKFIGTTICYAFMQACGLVNDHLTTCPCHALSRGTPGVRRVQSGRIKNPRS